MSVNNITDKNENKASSEVQSNKIILAVPQLPLLNQKQNKKPINFIQNGEKVISSPVVPVSSIQTINASSIPQNISIQNLVNQGHQNKVFRSGSNNSQVSGDIKAQQVIKSVFVNSSLNQMTRQNKTAPNCSSIAPNPNQLIMSLNNNLVSSVVQNRTNSMPNFSESQNPNLSNIQSFNASMEQSKRTPVTNQIMNVNQFSQPQQHQQKNLVGSNPTLAMIPGQNGPIDASNPGIGIAQAGLGHVPPGTDFKKILMNLNRCLGLRCLGRRGDTYGFGFEKDFYFILLGYYNKLLVSITSSSI